MGAAGGAGAEVLAGTDGVLRVRAHGTAPRRTRPGAGWPCLSWGERTLYALGPLVGPWLHPPTRGPLGQPGPQQFIPRMRTRADLNPRRGWCSGRHPHTVSPCPPCRWRPHHGLRGLRVFGLRPCGLSCCSQWTLAGSLGGRGQEAGLGCGPAAPAGVLGRHELQLPLGCFLPGGTVCPESGAGWVCGPPVCLSTAVGQPGPLIGLMLWGRCPSDHLEPLGVTGRGVCLGDFWRRLPVALEPGGGGQDAVLWGGRSHRAASRVDFL